mgnify:CR=1 FL=1
MVKRTIIFRIAVAALAALLTLALIACDNGTSNTNPQNTLTDEANEELGTTDMVSTTEAATTEEEQTTETVST